MSTANLLLKNQEIPLLDCYDILVAFSEHHPIVISDFTLGTGTQAQFCKTLTYCHDCKIKISCELTTQDKLPTISKQTYNKFAQEYPERLI